MNQFASFVICILISFNCFSQKVGVVLSGGGSSALSHIGVLKALEENNIPIDYISGTSMGAVIGAMYASGISAKQMENIVLQQGFQDLMIGREDPKYRRYIGSKPHNASIIPIRLYIDSLLETSIPTNYVKPYAMDFALLEMFAPISAAANYDFDSLMIPFRCVASDITNKKQIVFKHGNIEQAVRASASYPFYYNPLEIDGHIMYDGGLYNNFTSDIMCGTFSPDYIIGSNVSYNYALPNSNSLLSILKHMLVNETNYDIPCNKGVIIDPNIDIPTFDFSQVQTCIDSGYNATIYKIEEIKRNVNREETEAQRYAKRIDFRKKVTPLIIDDVKINGVNKFQSRFVKNTFGRLKTPKSIGDLKGGYYRVFANDKIKYVFPGALKSDTSNYYQLQLDITREKDLILDFGGNFSSKPANFGYVGVKYNYLGATGVLLEANSYFGKFYGSAHASARFDFPTAIPFNIEPIFTINRWDYFNNSATFFEDSRPSYKILSERYLGARSALPFRGAGKVTADYKRFYQDYQYYQIENFTSTDTSDITSFEGFTYGLNYTINTLNQKQFANAGGLLSLTARYMEGDEHTIPGSTTIIKEQFDKEHYWLQAKLKFEQYFKIDRKIKLGIEGEAFFSHQPFFQNYTATLMSSSAYQPTLESKTQFLNLFRAHKYIGTGLIAETNIWKNLVFRGEAHVFQPYEELKREIGTEKQFRGEAFDKRRFLFAGTLLFRNPIAPLSLSVNYNDETENVSIMFNFGYLIFNQNTTD